jgi:hypothetical protein
VRKGLVDGGGARLVDNEFEDPNEHGAVLNSVLVSAIHFLLCCEICSLVMHVGCSRRASAHTVGSAPRSDG